MYSIVLFLVKDVKMNGGFFVFRSLYFSEGEEKCIYKVVCDVYCKICVMN